MVNLSKNSESLQTWACLVRGFLFLFSKQYENNVQNFEIETSFQ